MYQELWFSLARKPWAALVLVPAHPGGTAGPIATSLADVGGRLRDTPITAIVADEVDYASARMLAEMQALASRTRRRPAVTDDAERARTEPPGGTEPAQRDPGPPGAPGQVIVAIPSVATEPLGVALAHAADAVVVCVERGRSTVREIRRTVELIGPERITGALFLR
jgi:hypothetical protein